MITRHSTLGKSRSGVTLVELLTVIGILGLLIALLLPSLDEARGASRRTQCQNQLRQLAIAANHFHAARNQFPAGLEQMEFPTSPRFRGTSLFAFLLPFLEEGNVVRDWDYKVPLANTDGGRQSRSATYIAMLQCPSDSLTSTPIQNGAQYFGMTSYGGNGGTRSVDPAYATIDGVFHTTGPASEPQPQQQPVSLSEITDGTSHTILFGERLHEDPNFDTFVAASWTDSLAQIGKWAALGGRKRIGDVTLSAFGGLNYRLPFSYEQRDTTSPALQNSRDFALYEDRRVCSFGSDHHGGANFSFVDGSSHFLHNKIDTQVLIAFCTRALEEIIDE